MLVFQSDSNPNPTIIILDDQNNRERLVKSMVTESGAYLKRVESLSELNQASVTSHSKIALIGLGENQLKKVTLLEAIKLLTKEGIKVIIYGEDVTSWPMAVYFGFFLVGASYIIDSKKTSFPTELKLYLMRLLQGENERSNREENIRELMNNLNIVGESRDMKKIVQYAEKISKLSDVPVLISGETGTGKELIANAIHKLDPKRRDGPFIVINCGAIVPSLAEAELFGHRRGAFTGAVHNRMGFIRSAEKGVLFLDEIGDMELGLQVKLLRVLENRSVLGVGEDKEVPVDVRIIAATNQDLNQLLLQKKFRDDLFHRINVLSINIPPVRERPDDIKPLIDHFLRKNQFMIPGMNTSINEELLKAFRLLELRGNAREIENIIRQSLITKEDDEPLGVGDLPPTVLQQLLISESAQSTNQQNLDSNIQFEKLVIESGWNLSRFLGYCEKLLLDSALHQRNFNQSDVARLLGITPRSVYNKIKKYHLTPTRSYSC
jgi:two-component system response regulator PilR (NtrC family)